MGLLVVYGLTEVEWKTVNISRLLTLLLVYSFKFWCPAAGSLCHIFGTSRWSLSRRWAELIIFVVRASKGARIDGFSCVDLCNRLRRNSRNPSLRLLGWCSSRLLGWWTRDTERKESWGSRSEARADLRGCACLLVVARIYNMRVQIWWEIDHFYCFSIFVWVWPHPVMTIAQPLILSVAEILECE